MLRLVKVLMMVLPLIVGAAGISKASEVPTVSVATHYDVDGGDAGPQASEEPWSVLLARGAQTSTSRLHSAAGSRARTSSTPTAPRYVVVMVLDGGRPDYLNVPGIPHIRALMKSGSVYTNAFAGVLESETPTGHAALGSGMEPNSNGILGFGWQNETSNWVSIFNPVAIQNHVLENLMSGAPSLAARLHQHNRNIRVAAVGSYKYYANDALGGPDADYTLYYAPTKTGKYAPVAVPGHVPPAKLLQHPDIIAPTYKHLPLGESDHLAMLLAAHTFTDTQSRVIMLNLPELDYPVGHYYGANRDQKDVRTLMQGFDRDLAMLEETYRKAGVLNQTAFVITADHGFQAFDHIVPPDEIDGAIARTGLKVTHASYESADYLWVNDRTRANDAARAVAQLVDPHIQSVYFKETTGSGVQYVRASDPALFEAPSMEAANQLLLRSFAGPTSPDIVVFFRQGTDGARPDAGWKGDHGGGDWESQHIPLIISGPGIRQNYVSSYPARLIDITPTILSLFGAKYQGMDGTPLADALLQAPADALQRQAANAGPLLQAVTAMAAESEAERAADSAASRDIVTSP